MSREMLINVSQGEECRIALLDNGRLQELYMERTSATSHVGNIYKGRVTNVEASIQAAFVDFGLGRNGFLHISDLMPSYFGRDGGDIQESVGRKLSRRDRPPIQRCLRRGDEIVVQIIKEGIGTKGPTLSTYISIPGRILVMMPGMGKFGVSRKIEDDEERRRLRMILDGLKPIKDVGFIIRTAGIGKTGAEIERDLTYLTRLWENIQRKMRESAPVELYTEGDLVTRTVRDAYSSDLDRIVVDNAEVGKRIKDFFKIAMPSNRSRIELYDSPVPLFHQANIEREIEMMNSRHVPLPSGGSLVIDSTEAVVAIDVNSGKFREHNDAEMTAFKTDMEAADEIPRQLKLRDLGGVIICDFIDLRFDRNRRELEERLHDNFKNDRAKTKVLRMSQFGIIELTRQRMRPSLKRSIYCDCPHCQGAGLVKTPESMSLDVMRRLAIAAYDPKVAWIEMTVGSAVGVYVLNKKRAELTALEADSGRRIIVKQDATLGIDESRLKLLDARDGFVFLEELGMDPNDARDEEPRRAQPAVRQRRGGRGGRPLPQTRGRHDSDEEGDELDHAEDSIDQRDEENENAMMPAATPVPLKVRAIPKVPLGKVIGTLLTDEDEVIDEHESSVIEVDEPNEPLGDGPREFEEDSRGRSFDRNRGFNDRNAPRGNRGGGRDGGSNRPSDDRPEGRRDVRQTGTSDTRPGARPAGRNDTRPGLPRPIDQGARDQSGRDQGGRDQRSRNGNRGNRSGRPFAGADAPGRDPAVSRDDYIEDDRDPTRGESGDADHATGDANGNRIDGPPNQHDDDRNADGSPRRRRRRGRRGRGTGNLNGPRDQSEDAPHDRDAARSPDDAAIDSASNIRNADGPDDEHADAAFGTSDDSAEIVGMAGEEIDADAIDAEFDRPAGAGIASEAREAGGAANGDGPDDDRPRRRRRRGGRRHRRNRDGDDRPLNAGATDNVAAGPAARGETFAADQDAGEDADEDEDHGVDHNADSLDREIDTPANGGKVIADGNKFDGAEVNGDEFDDDEADDDRVVAVTPFPPIAEDEFDDARQDLNDSIDAGEHTEVKDVGRPVSIDDRALEAGVRSEAGPTPDDLVEKPSRSRGGRPAAKARGSRGRSATQRGREIEAGITSEPAAAVEPPDPDAADDEASSPKSKRRRGGRAAPAGARRVSRKPPATEPSAPSKASIAEGKPDAGRTGSTDRHLVDDVAVDAEPPRAVRSYEDLDTVPDDFD